CSTPFGSFLCDDVNAFHSTLSDGERSRYRDGCKREGYRSISIVPIHYRDAIVGAVHLADRESGKFSLKHVQSIESLTPIIGEAIHRLSLEEDLHNNYFSEAAINMILSLSLEDIPLEDFFVKTLNMILSVPWLSFESGGKIFLVGNEPGVLVLKAQNNVPESAQSSCVRVPFGKCLCGRAAESQKIQFADCVDQRHEICCEEMSPHGHYAVPVLFGGRTLGVISVRLKEKHMSNHREADLLQTIADTLAGIIVRLQAESELKRSRASLANAQRIARLGNWEWDISRDAFIWSDETYRIFGIDHRDQSLTYEIFLNHVHPEDREFVNKSINEALYENKPYNVEHRISLPDGSERVVNEHAEVTFDQDYGPVRMLGTVQDITEHKLAEQHKERLQAQLLQSQKMEAVGQLTGGIAHDFNNILTAIMTYGQFLLMKLPEDAPLKNYVNQILAASEKAATLTHSLLAFSRKQVTNPRPVNLSDIIKEMGNLFFRAIGEDIEFKPILSDEDLTIMADPKQIDQILLNLLTNSRDAMPDGGVLLLETNRVQIDDAFIRSHGYGSPGEYALLSVTDTGTGIDTEVKGRIFEPFFTTKDVGKGTGLGLAMVYGIIKQHNGYINVYSEQGQGTTFHIYFPLIAAPPTGIPPEPAVSLEKGTETILLAEDNTEVRVSTKTLLENHGYSVIEASNGEDAIRLYTDHRDTIDLALLDVIMPKGNGREVYDKLRQLNPRVKVLFISGYTANIPDKIMALDKGLDIISKPFSKIQILTKIREVLSG
ncbi:MAG TPA: ATP-binding protein, partial [Thermodesulfovibrionales bacterium]|nr:ATP-binding protein [Thermodesulfovibrionales bacterium]